MKFVCFLFFSVCVCTEIVAQNQLETLEKKLSNGKEKEWHFVNQRKSRGEAAPVDSCLSQQFLRFQMASRTVLYRLCKDGKLETKQTKFGLQIRNNEPVLVLDQNTGYYIRFVTKDGKEILRLTRPGATKIDYSDIIYLQ